MIFTLNDTLIAISEWQITSRTLLFLTTRNLEPFPSNTQQAQVIQRNQSELKAL